MAKLDLNLMAVLEAIYDEGSISRAGEVLFLSQSAVSHALARLRDIYQDPLFVRQGHRMQPTPLTERVIIKIKEGLRKIRSSVDEAHSFDPTVDGHDFQIGMRDAMETAILPSLLELLDKDAPLVNLKTRHVLPYDIEDQLTLGKLDLCLEILKPVSDVIRHAPLFEETLVVVGRKNHPVFAQKLKVEDVLKYRQILVSPLHSEPEWVDHALASLGLRRNVVLRCQSYTSAIQVLLTTDNLSIMPKGYVELLAKRMPIAFTEVPFKVPQVEIHLFWHQRHDLDPANTWMRQRLVMALDKVSSIKADKLALERVSFRGE